MTEAEREAVFLARLAELRRENAIRTGQAPRWERLDVRVVLLAVGVVALVVALLI